MKRFILVVIVVLAFLCVGATVTHTTHIGTMNRIKVAFDADVNDVSVTAGSIYGTLQRIVIDSAGEDLSFKVYLKDAATSTLWSNTNCSSTQDPNSLPLTMTDGSTTFLGIPHTGALTLQIADANDSSMTDLDIYIYYK